MDIALVSDLNYFYDPAGIIHRIIVATRDPDNTEFRSLQIVDDRVGEDYVTVEPARVVSTPNSEE